MTTGRINSGGMTKRQYVDRDETTAGRITLEITESALMADPSKARKALMFLSQQGIRFSIDDLVLATHPSRISNICR